jgi:hypothetical protein
VPHSFVAGTGVLLADGSSKPIEQTQPGDTVMATDPITGQMQARQVTHTIRTDDDKQFVDLTIRDPNTGNDQTVTTTEHHPFWSVTQGRWVDAGKLQSGELLRTSAGTYVQITAIRHYQGERVTYDLTVEITHTYFVTAAGSSVLVHNCPLDNASPDDLHSVATAGGSPRRLSPAGRALQKHADPTRPQVQRDRYDYGATTNADRNFIGNTLVEEILTDPNAVRRLNHGASAHYGGSTLDIIMGNGIGARWSMRGGRISFEGFL